jgi:PAS domain S-box-containing protein
MCEILDIMKSTVTNKNLFSMDLLTAKSLPVVIQEFEQLLSEKIAASYTTEIKNRVGRILDVEISSFFLVKKDNEVDNFVLIVRDITSRNEVELKRAREHELLKTLMDNIPDSVYFKDNQNRFVLVNKAKAAHSNVKPEEMIGKTDFDFFPQEQAQRILDDDNAIIRSGQRIINKLECLVRNDGSEQLVSETKIPRYNEDGDIIGTMGITRDITDWKHSEDELTRNLEMLQTLMDNIPDSVCFKDIQNRFVLVNQAKAKHWNVQPGAMIGKTDFDFLPTDQAQKAFEEDNKILQTGQSIINCIEKITDSNGSEQWYSITKLPRYDLKGKIIGILSISRNVTEWKKV